MKENLEAEFILVGSGDNCPPCDKIKGMLREQIASGKVKYVDINSEEGIRYAKELDSVNIPYVLRSRDNKECQVFADEDMLLVKCGEEITPLVEPPATSE